MAIALFVMISSHIEVFSQRWYVDALVYHGAPFWPTSFYFYAQGPLLVVMALAAVNWLRVGR